MLALANQSAVEVTGPDKDGYIMLIQIDRPEDFIHVVSVHKTNISRLIQLLWEASKSNEQKV